MPVTATPVSGTDGRIWLAGNFLILDGWDVNPTAGEIKVPSFESDYMQRLGGLKDCTFNFQGNYNKDQPPFSFYNLYPGNQAQPLRLYISKTSNLYFNFPLWFLREVPVVVDINDKAARISFKCASDGPWFWPL